MKKKKRGIDIDEETLLIDDIEADIYGRDKKGRPKGKHAWLWN